jgi:hypothetical protein
LALLETPAAGRRWVGMGVALLALALTAGAFFAQWRIDFNIADEGFLWYGAIATAHGEVPLRDFQSYDPGRYYWAAGWAPLLGDGILALRCSTAVFAALGLCCGLLAARRALARPWSLALAGILLLLWMFPRHKLFEPAIAMAAVWVGVRLLERPSRGRHFAAGVLAGLAAFFGKNLGLYCLAAMLCLALAAHLGAPAGGDRPPAGRRLAAFAAGLLAGLLPLLAMFCIPGFPAAFVDSCLLFVRLGRTNFPEPFPWPTLALEPGLDGWDRAQRLALGLSFLLLAGGTAAAVAAGWRRARREGRPPALLLAGGVVSAFFLHHAFARTDPFHLAQSVHPLLLASFALTAAGRPGSSGRPAGRTLPRSAAGAALIAASIAFSTLFTALPEAPLFHRLAADRRQEMFVPFDLAGDALYVREHAAHVLDALRFDFSQDVPPGEPVFLATHFAGLYPFLGRHSPVWEIYPIWPGEGERDERMLRELQAHRVRWALIGAYARQGGEELTLAQTHPKVWLYLMQEFDRVPSGELPRRFLLLHKR